MSDLDFTEEEIREQLEKLGYHNVPAARLREFKQDLEYLVKHERSRNSSWSTLTGGSSTDLEVAPSLYVARSAVGDPEKIYSAQPRNETREDHSVCGKETSRHDNGVGSLAVPPAGINASPSLTQYRGPDRGYSEAEEIQTDTDTSSCTDKRLIKRRVLRKKEGHSQICDELTESEMGDVSSLEDRLCHLEIPDKMPQKKSGLGKKPSDTSRHPSRPQSASSYEFSYRLPDDYEGPKALIRPMTVEPHRRNIRKCDPVSRFLEYKQSWDVQRAPGEKQHKNLRWSVREQMLYHDEVVEKKQHRVFIPNTYKVPTEKKRKNLRWQVRMDLAQGVRPPSMFD